MKIIPVFTILLFLFLFSCQPGNQKETYPDIVIEKLEEMSLEEKVGQMTMICLSEVTEGRDKRLVMDEARFRDFIENYHIGSFLSATGSAEEWISFTRRAQEINMEVSGTQIPLVFGVDHIHGANYANEGTFFPHQLMLSCSFDTALISKVAKATARETAGLGILWNFAPVLDVGKNPYWPRLYETFGEDPYLCTQLGSAYVGSFEDYRTLSGHQPVGCLKHFIGYSDPRSGYDRSPAEIPDQILNEVFIPPFRESIRAGAGAVMINSGEVNGVPVHISEKYIQQILRGRLGFDGVVITDIKDILKLVEMHHAVPDPEEAVILAVKAGIDISMSCNDTDFYRILLEKIKEGVISEERINRSVKRILYMKYRMGLFEDPYPEDDFDFNNDSDIHEHRILAYEAAQASQVLLKNDGILPLDVNSNILLTGYSIDSKRNLNGAWTLEWLGAEESRQPEDMKTLLDAFHSEWNGKVIFADPRSPGFGNEFMEKAENADYVIVTAGEEPYSEFKGNIDNLDLNSRYREVVELAFATGKPVIIVLIEGRPRLLNDISEYSGAILFAGYPGIMAADAIVSIICGKANPSGKLSFSYPSGEAGYAPYNSRITRMYEPAYPFGHGLSYTDFSYSYLDLSDTILNPKEDLEISVRVENSGDIAGNETVLLFVSDLYGKITRPRKELRRFTKVFLEPGESKDIHFILNTDIDLSYPDESGNIILEPGEFEINCGGIRKKFMLK